MRKPRVTMPKWPAYLMGAFAAACILSAATMPPPAAEGYSAVGQPPAAAARTATAGPAQPSTATPAQPSVVQRAQAIGAATTP